MFGQGLESLLSQEPKLQVVGLETEPKQALKAIREFQPDVVILYADDSLASSEVLITEVLKINPNTKVVHLSLQNNVFHVYQVTRRIATDLDDLIEAIQDTSISPRGSHSETHWVNQGNYSQISSQRDHEDFSNL
jgi:DNA-binding NarL/FixJ family response regulator